MIQSGDYYGWISHANSLLLFVPRYLGEKSLIISARLFFDLLSAATISVYPIQSISIRFAEIPNSLTKTRFTLAARALTDHDWFLGPEIVRMENNFRTCYNDKSISQGIFLLTLLTAGFVFYV